MSIQDQDRLASHVQSIVDTIENGFSDDDLNYDDEPMTSYDYLSDVLDINWILNSDRTYKAAKVLVAFGGPNIWINTEKQQVEGYWWGSQSIIPYNQDSIGLDETLEEIFNC